MVMDHSPGWSALTLGLSLASGLLPAASLLITKRFVDTLNVLLASPAEARAFAPVAGLAALLGLIMLAEKLLAQAEQYAIQAQSLAFGDHMGEHLARKAMGVDLVRLENPGFFDSMLLARSQASQRPLSMLRQTSVAARSLVALGVVIGVLSGTSLWFLPCVAVATIPGLWAQFHTSRRLREWQIRHVQEERRASYLETLTYSPAHAKELRVFGFESYLLALWRSARAHLRTAQLRLTTQRAARTLGADLLSLVLLAATFGTLGLLALKGCHYTLGDLAMVYKAFTLGRSALNSLLGCATSLYEDSVFLDAYHDYMAVPESITTPADACRVPTRLEKGLQLDKVSFRYPGRDLNALTDIDLSIPPGRHVALVGENGAGKTTLIKLLCRLYDPVAGQVSLEGVDLRRYRPRDIRDQFSILFQDFGRYDLVAEENIRLADTRIPPGDPRLAQAADRAGARDLLASLPQGSRTQLGRMFAGGVELSAGQWQKLALARAFVREAPFVILDEPSSALDPRAEYELFLKFHEMMRDRTAIIISHRFSTVRMVDHIIVLSNGRIVEQGSHDVLMAQAGMYHELYTLQADPYR